MKRVIYWTIYLSLAYFCSLTLQAGLPWKSPSTSDSNLATSYNFDNTKVTNIGASTLTDAQKDQMQRTLNPQSTPEASGATNQASPASTSKPPASSIKSIMMNKIINLFKPKQPNIDEQSQPKDEQSQNPRPVIIEGVLRYDPDNPQSSEEIRAKQKKALEENLQRNLDRIDIDYAQQKMKENDIDFKLYDNDHSPDAQRKIIDAARQFGKEEISIDQLKQNLIEIKQKDDKDKAAAAQAQRDARLQNEARFPDETPAVKPVPPTNPPEQDTPEIVKPIDSPEGTPDNQKLNENQAPVPDAPKEPLRKLGDPTIPPPLRPAKPRVSQPTISPTPQPAPAQPKPPSRPAKSTPEDKTAAADPTKLTPEDINRILDEYFKPDNVPYRPAQPRQTPVATPNPTVAPAQDNLPPTTQSLQKLGNQLPPPLRPPLSPAAGSKYNFGNNPPKAPATD